MPEIAISEEQRAYLDALIEHLKAEHVGSYGTVRDRDALQYLIDQHRGSDDNRTPGSADDPTTASDSEPEPSEASEEEPEADLGETASRSDAPGSGEPSMGDGNGESAGDTNRLEAMMNLLDRHNDKWETTDSEQGKYRVDLPDGETATARTRDDVRALLFKHYG